MKVIGITGGVGSGKSTVLQLIKEHYDCSIVILDAVGQKLQEKGGKSYDLIVSHFGSDILLEDGQINRKKLAALVFQDKKMLDVLNSFVHPLVMNYVLNKLQQVRDEGTLTFFFIESAILFEAGYEELCDEIWFISADDEVRRMRLKESRGYSDDKIDTILANQLKEEEFVNRCTHIVKNNGDTLDLMNQIRMLLESP